MPVLRYPELMGCLRELALHHRYSVHKRRLLVLQQGCFYLKGERLLVLHCHGSPEPL